MDNYLIDLMKKEKENGYHFANVDTLSLAYKLIENIGDSNPEIRDGLIYGTLAHLFTDDHFDRDSLTLFFEILISDKYLLFDMNNEFENSVLKRSFTILQLVYFVGMHNEKPFLSTSQYMAMYLNFMNCFKNEKILQGYDETNGWMHTVAHSADLLAEMMKSPEMNKTMMEEIFQAIKGKFAISTYNYVNDEDERMVTAIVNALERNILDNDFVINWINSFGLVEKTKSFPGRYYIKNNIKNLLRSLYFRIFNEAKFSVFIPSLENTIVSLK